MTVPVTPMAAFLSHLLSLGHAGQQVTEIVRLAEAAFASPTRPSGSVEEKREKERIRKAAYRDRLSRNVPRDSVGGVLSLEVTKTLNPTKKVSKKEPACPALSRGTTGQPDDGWPADHVEQFWNNFPPFRREAKRKVAEKLARLRKDGIVAWPTLLNAVMKFAATDPGQYAPAPIVWLNGERWDREYGPAGGPNGKAQVALDPNKLGFAGQAALRRHRIAQGPERPAPEDLEPLNGR